MSLLSPVVYIVHELKIQPHVFTMASVTQRRCELTYIDVVHSNASYKFHSWYPILFVQHCNKVDLVLIVAEF